MGERALIIAIQPRDLLLLKTIYQFPYSRGLCSNGAKTWDVSLESL
jgi:hypothetical protein